nr:LamG-like jellyroll fold domain-containing protein [uncultured Rhodoferax sp.]
MPTIINPLITDVGLAAAINANANGLQLAITHIALGSGQYTPSASQSALATLKEAVTVADGFVSATGGFRVNGLFPSWAGTPNPYNATEIGFYAGDPGAGGILFAVHSHPSSVIVQRNSLDYMCQFALQLSRVPAGSVAVTIDPGASQALALIAAHEANIDPHPFYALKSKIIVEASSLAEETAAFAAGAAMVIRLDLLSAATTTTAAPTTTTTTAAPTTTTAAPLPNTIAMLLHMDGVDGSGVFVDSSNHAHTVALTGSPVIRTTSPKLGTGFGDFGGAANFLTVADAPILRFGTGDWGIGTYHRMSGAMGSSHSFIASKGAPGDLAASWYFYIMNSGQLTFSTANNNTVIYAPYPYINDVVNYHHIELDCVSNLLTAYVDGAVLAAVDITATPLAEGAGDLYIGGWNYTTANARADHLDEFVISSGSALHAAPFTPPIVPY